jgi:hypothetical protein
MTSTQEWIGYLWRVPVCALAYVLGSVIGGMMLPLLGVSMPAMPEGADPQTLMRDMLLAALVLAVGLTPLSRHLAGSLHARVAILSALIWVCATLNTVIEARIFSTLFAQGGALSLVLHGILPSLVCGAVLAALIHVDTSPEQSPSNLAAYLTFRRPQSWAWRLPLTVLAFPVIYFVFGAAIAPIVMPYYQNSSIGLVVPNPGTILLTQLGRSALFLLVTLPIMAFWAGTLRRLALSLGLAYSVLVGLFGLIQASWFPPILRITHSVEICADSFTYALVLVALLGVNRLSGQQKIGTTEGTAMAA